jgi:hypothetical protein
MLQLPGNFRSILLLLLLREPGLLLLLLAGNLARI